MTRVYGVHQSTLEALVNIRSLRHFKFAVGRLRMRSRGSFTTCATLLYFVNPSPHRQSGCYLTDYTRLRAILYHARDPTYHMETSELWTKSSIKWPGDVRQRPK